MSAKIAILGDIHFGAHQGAGKQHPTLNVNTRLLDYVQTLDLAFADMINYGVTEAVLTGDIFEHRYPTIVQQKLFSQCLSKALSSGIEKIHIVIGNHDQQRIHTTTTISYLKELNLENIRIYDEMEMVAVRWCGRPTANLVFMPYRDRLWLGAQTHTEAVNMMRDELESVMSARDQKLPTILVGHMTIEGTFIDDEYKDLYGENQLSLPKDMFNKINLTIMGHIHKPEVLSTNPYIAYIGSMEKRGGYENHDKIYGIVDLSKSSVEYRKLPCREIYDIQIDTASSVRGEDLHRDIMASIEQFSKTHPLLGAIVRISIRHLSEDSQYLDTRKVVSDTISGFECSYADVKSEAMTVRQARDDRITEDVSHISAFKMYMENQLAEDRFVAEIINAGIDIMNETGDH